MFLYLINLTFFAGNDTPENTDRGLYCLKSPEPVTDNMLLSAYKAANSALNNADDDADLSYDDGCNIDTLNKGAEKQLRTIISKTAPPDSVHSVEITELRPCSGGMYIENYYDVEIWQ